MTKNDILEWFIVNNETLGAGKILFVLGFGLFVASIIFITYRITYAGVCYNAKFNIGNVVLLLISAVVMLMISSNIAISLGMVGALSIVRFRTAIKDAHDTVYIFWAIVEGLCVGAQVFKLAIISSIVIALILVGTSFYYNTKKKYLIIIRGTEEINTNDLIDCIKEVYKNPCIKAANFEKNHSELIIEVSAKNEIKSEVVEELRKIKSVVSVNWLLEMGEHIG